MTNLESGNLAQWSDILMCTLEQQKGDTAGTNNYNKTLDYGTFELLQGCLETTAVTHILMIWF